MDSKAVDATQIAPPPGLAPHDFSVIGLFMQADIVVKAIMIGLLLWSIWSLAIMFEKWVRLRTLNARAEKFEDAFWSGGSLDVLYERVAKKVRDPMVATFVAGMREWKLASERGAASGGVLHGNLQQRVDRV